MDGIILSNHGGRQLNYAPAAIDMLPSVAEAVAGRVPLLVDGCVTRGTGAWCGGRAGRGSGPPAPAALLWGAAMRAACVRHQRPPALRLGVPG